MLDNYQLKSLDGILEAPLEEVRIIKKDNKYHLELMDYSSGNSSEMFDNFSMRDAYDRIIRCLGFIFDQSIFTK